MDTLWFYIDLGFWHVMDLAGLDHLYFIITLAAPFGFKQSKKLIWWVTLFTLGHTLSLIGNFYAEIDFSSYWIELLIPITIAFSAVSLLFYKSTYLGKKNLVVFPTLTVLFGVIHGLGFGRYFSMLIPEEAVGLSLFSFAVGVDCFRRVGFKLFSGWFNEKIKAQMGIFSWSHGAFSSIGHDI
jgi:hypothetical protein